MNPALTSQSHHSHALELERVILIWQRIESKEREFWQQYIILFLCMLVTVALSQLKVENFEFPTTKALHFTHQFHSPTMNSKLTPLEELLSFLLNSLLCSKNLPTRPSDHLKQTDPFHYQASGSMKPQKISPGSATPCLVAKLMGLDSMPGMDDPEFCSSIARSKSANSGVCEGVHLNQHRRAKTSVSFRETASYFELEDDDFFVISFDSGGKKGKPRSEKARAEMGRRENEQRRRRRRGGKDQRPRFKFEEGSSEALVLEIENSHQLIGRKKKEMRWDGAKGAAFESESENSSPVSVLDHSLFIADQDTPASDKDTTSQNSSPRRELASELTKLNQSSHSRNEVCSEKNDRSPSENNQVQRRKDGRRRRKRERMNKLVCKFAEEEMAELEWKCNGGLMRNLKIWKSEIGVELGLQIVDQLVDEAVQQLI